MKIVLIDAERMNDKGFHIYFKRKLDIKGYHGNNLDAMYDTLSTLREELKVYVYNFQEQSLSRYGNSVWNTLKELSYSNENISLKEIKISKKILN
ncbi:MAG: barstar family protein [Bacillota bacterium]